MTMTLCLHVNYQIAYIRANILLLSNNIPLLSLNLLSSHWRAQIKCELWWHDTWISIKIGTKLEHLRSQKKLSLWCYKVKVFFFWRRSQPCDVCWIQWKQKVLCQCSRRSRVGRTSSAGLQFRVPEEFFYKKNKKNNPHTNNSVPVHIRSLTERETQGLKVPLSVL